MLSFSINKQKKKVLHNSKYCFFPCKQECNFSIWLFSLFVAQEILFVQAIKSFLTHSNNAYMELKMYLQNQSKQFKVPQNSLLWQQILTTIRLFQCIWISHFILSFTRRNSDDFIKHPTWIKLHQIVTLVIKS